MTVVSYGKHFAPKATPIVTDLDGWTPVDGSPSMKTWIEHKTDDGKLLTGFWEAMPGTYRVVYAADEFIHMFEGKDGHGVGAQIEAMISYDITERLSLGIGARYWAMWTTEASMTRSFDASGPVAPLTQHLKLETERAGIFGQALYRFD